MATKKDEQLARRVTDRLLGPHSTLTLEIHAEAEDDERVRLVSLIAQLDAIRDVLRNTERVMYGREGGVYYRVVSLSQKSPASITIEAVPVNVHHSYGPALFGQVVENFETLADTPSDYVPRELDLPALLAYKNAAPTPQRHISELVLRNGKGTVNLDRSFGGSVQRAIGPDKITRGEVFGALEVVNLHRKQRFEIFPPLGDYRILCRFKPEQKAEVIAALDRFVRVTGNIFYKQWSKHPHAIDVERIAVMPEEDDIPPFDVLRGSLPHLTDQLLEAARDALW